MASYYLALCISLYLTTFHPSDTATVERELGYSQGTAFATNFNDGSYAVFPDTPTVVSEAEYRYFSENMDFETIEGRLLVGSADNLYLLSTTNLSIVDNGVLDWPSSMSNMDACLSSNLVTNSIIEGVYLCRNHIRLYQRVPYAPDLLYVCGTQSGRTPQCLALNISNDDFGSSTNPADTTSNIVSSNPDYPNIGDFRGSFPDDTAYISWSYRAEGTTNPFSFNRQNVTFNSSQETFTNTPDFGLLNRWIDTPATVIDIIPLSFTLSGSQPGENYDFYFVFLRERHQFTLENTLDTEPLVLSRVLRICRDDPGIDFGDTPIFSSLYKARIFCNQESPGTGNNPLGAVDNHYNDLWSIAINGDGGRSFPTGPYNRKLYGAFSTPLTGPTGTAICAYTVTPSTTGTLNRGIFDTFLEDISEDDGDETFTERENNFGSCNGEGRPLNPNSGIGAEDFLVSRTILQIGVNPLIVFDDFYVTKLVVDEACVVESTNRRRCINQDILFAGTNTGKIVKIVFGRNGSTTVPVVSEEITLDDPRFVKDIDVQVVDGMKFIFATTQSRVYKISVERCSRHRSYNECVGARDAYCAWNTVDQMCQYFNITADASSRSEVPTYLLQNIHLGEIVDPMPTIGIEMDSYIVDEAVGSISVAIIGDRPVPSGWVELDLINADLAVIESISVVISSPDNSTVIQVPLSKDTIFTGPRLFTLQLRNTVNGTAIFNRRRANLTVIDDDGIYAQVGLKYTEGSCLDLDERALLLADLNTTIAMITKGTISFISFKCNVTGENTLNVAVYRFTLTVSASVQVTRLTPRQAAATTTGQLVESLRAWVLKEVEIKTGKSTAQVESSCNVNVTSLDQPPCSFIAGNAQGLQSDSVPATASAAIFAVLFGITVGLCVILVIVIIILVNKQKKRPVSLESEKVFYDTGHGPSSTTLQKEAIYDNPDEDPKKEGIVVVQTSLTSSSSSGSQRSPPPVDSINSAAPLMQNGIESKKSPFNFPVPFARKNSPSVAHDGPRMSLESPRSGKRKSVESMVDTGTPRGSGMGVTDSPVRCESAGGRVLVYDSPSKGAGINSPLNTAISYSNTNTGKRDSGMNRSSGGYGGAEITIKTGDEHNIAV